MADYISSNGPRFDASVSSEQCIDSASDEAAPREFQNVEPVAHSLGEFFERHLRLKAESNRPINLTILEDETLIGLYLQLLISSGLYFQLLERHQITLACLATLIRSSNFTELRNNWVDATYRDVIRMSGIGINSADDAIRELIEVKLLRWVKIRDPLTKRRRKVLELLPPNPLNQIAYYEVEYGDGTTRRKKTKICLAMETFAAMKSAPAKKTMAGAQSAPAKEIMHGALSERSEPEQKTFAAIESAPAVKTMAGAHSAPAVENGEKSVENLMRGALSGEVASGTKNAPTTTTSTTVVEVGDEKAAVEALLKEFRIGNPKRDELLAKPSTTLLRVKAARLELGSRPLKLFRGLLIDLIDGKADIDPDNYARAKGEVLRQAAADESTWSDAHRGNVAKLRALGPGLRQVMLDLNAAYPGSTRVNNFVRDWLNFAENPEGCAFLVKWMEEKQGGAR